MKPPFPTPTKKGVKWRKIMKGCGLTKDYELILCQEK